MTNICVLPINAIIESLAIPFIYNSRGSRTPSWLPHTTVLQIINPICVVDIRNLIASLYDLSEKFMSPNQCGSLTRYARKADLLLRVGQGTRLSYLGHAFRSAFTSVRYCVKLVLGTYKPGRTHTVFTGNTPLLALLEQKHTEHNTFSVIICWSYILYYFYRPLHAQLQQDL